MLRKEGNAEAAVTSREIFKINERELVETRLQGSRGYSQLEV